MAQHPCPFRETIVNDESSCEVDTDVLIALSSVESNLRMPGRSLSVRLQWGYQQERPVSQVQRPSPTVGVLTVPSLIHTYITANVKSVVNFYIHIGKS